MSDNRRENDEERKALRLSDADFRRLARAAAQEVFNSIGIPKAARYIRSARFAAAVLIGYAAGHGWIDLKAILKWLAQ